MALRKLKRTIRRRTMRKRAPTNRTLNKKIKKIQSHQENKQFFVDQTNVNLTSAAVDIQALSEIEVGDTNINRDGEFVTATSIQWRGRFTPATSNAVSQCVRHIVFWDLQSNSTVLTASTLLLEDPLNVYSSYLTQGVSPRFKVLHDKIYNLVYTSETAAPAINCRVAINKKKKSFSRKITWNTAASAAVPASNALYSMVMTDAATNGANVLLEFKLVFKDD